MKVGIDMRMSGEGFGIGTYINELVSALLKKGSGIEYVLFFADNFSRDGYKRFSSLGANCRLLKVPHYSAAEQIQLPHLLNKERLDLMHFPNFNVPVLYPGKFVLTLHDLIHHKFPGRKKRNFVYRWGYRTIIKTAAARARKIIAVSETTKKDIQNFLKIDENKIAVVYEGVKEIFETANLETNVKKTLGKHNITKPYLLTVGVWRRYKNLPALAKAFDTLKRQTGLPHKLVMAGEVDAYYPEIEKQVMSVASSDSIIATGKISDSELKDLYTAAALYVSPSLSEGFGLTALEAQSCGAPVLSSDIPAAKEVLKDSALFFDPRDQPSFEKTLAEILKNERQLSELKARSLKNSKNFSWKKAAEQTEKIYLETAR